MMQGANFGEIAKAAPDARNQLRAFHRDPRSPARESPVSARRLVRLADAACFPRCGSCARSRPRLASRKNFRISCDGSSVSTRWVMAR